MSRNRVTLVHLSDTHLMDGDALLHGRIDSWARTVAALSAAAHFSPDAVIITGDIADRGQRVHDRAAKLFEHAEKELGCPIIVVPGNHDPAGAVGSGFNRNRLSSGLNPADTVHEVSGLRIIGLESHGFGEAEGRLDNNQIQWLRGILDTPAPRGTVLALHHPPVGSMIPGLAGRGLARPGELAAVLEGSDVNGILCGHYHLPSTSKLGNTPVWVGPAVSYNHNLFAPEGLIQGLDTSWISVIGLGAGTLSVAPVQVATPSAVFTREVSLASRQPALL